MNNKEKKNKRNKKNIIFSSTEIPIDKEYTAQIPIDAKERDLWKRVTLFQLIYSVCGLILGFVCILGGVVLFLHGITGSTSWIAKFIGVESNLSDAAPGAVLFIVGLLIVWITRFNLKTRK